MTVSTLPLVLALTGSPAPAPDEWRWPLGPPPPPVVRAFAPPAVPWGPGHRGVDLAARPGQTVRAAGAGRVAYAGLLAGRSVISLDHGALRTTYLPVRPALPTGAEVAAGTKIGVLESPATPHCPQACLHWGLRQGTVYLDPLRLVQRPVRLLPLWPPAAPAQRVVEPSEPPRVLASSIGPRETATAAGGALTGAVLSFAALFAWRQTRLRARRRTPADVIDLNRERELRRT
ncbi:M23 family metallopeptidase [Actinomadura flavalba]|uniref:M23 family metallopeptidase n=1 Tax=Actinomadura flavalba TaxID=1120938 RepID=UPI0003A5D7EE|nr:M23 family metallopeptidase [Actinomadura flavalba]